jgi:acetylglutamate kinase
MNVAEITAKAQVLLEALPYIQDFRGSTFVVKYGGSFMDDPDPVARARVAHDIAFLAAVGINVVVVHGGGKAITRAMETSGLKAEFVNGLRVTDEATIAVVKKTLDEIGTCARPSPVRKASRRACRVIPCSSAKSSQKTTTATRSTSATSAT